MNLTPELLAAQAVLAEKRRALGLNPDGTRPGGPTRLGAALADALDTLPIRNEQDLTWTCACGAVVLPLRIEILGRKRLVRGNCPTCKPEWLEREEYMARLQEQQERDRRLAEYRREFPSADMGSYQAARLDNFERRKGTENALKRAVEFVERLPHPDPPGLLLWGRSGSGKSHLAAGIANAARNKGLAVAWTHVPTWLRHVGTLEADHRERLLMLAARADLLVLDELGAGRLTISRLDWLLYVVEERYRRRRPLVVATNYSLDQLAALLDAAAREAGDDSEVTGDRLADRLVELCRQVEVRATSYRQVKASQLSGG